MPPARVFCNSFSNDFKMPQYCVALNCRNRCKSKCLDAQGRLITFHRFPNDPGRRQQWIAAVCRTGDEEKPWKPTACSCVCSVHFTENCFDTAGKAVRIRKDAVPTIFNFPKKVQNIILKPKAEQDSMEVTIESFNNISTSQEMASSRRYSENTFGKVLQEHNYYCASSPKSLKLALDKSMQMEQKLWNKLGNLVKLEKRLMKRVSQLLLQLGKGGLNDGQTNLHQLYSERAQGSIDMDTNEIANRVELDLGETSRKEADAFSFLELEKPNKRRGKFQRNSTDTAEKVINQSVEHEKSVHKIISSTKQQVIHKEENTDTCSECGNNVISNRTETGRQINPCLERSNNCRLSGTIPRRQWIPTKEKLYVCGECGKGFSMLASLIVHQRVHIKEKQYPCMKCGQTFSQSSNLTRHETVSLVKEEDLEASLIDHPVSVGACSTSPDPGIARTTPNVPFRINQEGVTYLMDLHEFEERETIRGLSGHPVVAAVFLVSVNQDGEATCIELEPQCLGDLGEAARGELSATSILPPCLNLGTEAHFIGEMESQGTSLCDRTTEREDGLPVKGVKRMLNKQRRMLDKPPPAEAQLKVVYNSSEEMHDGSQQWEKDHLNKRPKIDGLNSGFVKVEPFHLDQEILERQQSDKSDDNYAFNLKKSNTLKNQRLYLCTKCEKIFTKKSILTVHLRKHLGNKPYQCTECDKSFWKKSFLTWHLRTHFRERLYQCTECDKSFWRKLILAGHIRIHMGERSNMCIDYKKRCRQNSDLVHCRRRYTAERNWCFECNKGFIHSSQLIKHHKIHSGELLICTVCKKSFSHRDHLITHQRKYHTMRRNKIVKAINPR